MAKKPKKNVVDFNDTRLNFNGKNIADIVTGNDLNNEINGAGGNDKIKGMGGDDTLLGGGGNDRIWGGEGDDTMLGGLGDDKLFADGGNDTINGGGGDDILKLNVNYDDAVITTDGDGFKIETAEGTITVKNVELFRFADKTVTAEDLLQPDGVILTEGADNVTGNQIFAPRGFTPGGTDQVNTLNDDDIINGEGDDATLTVDFVNDADTGDNNIQATINGVANIITNVRTDSSATIDLQDSTGVKNLTVKGVDDFATFTYDNIQEMVETLNVTDSNAPNGGVEFLFDEDALGGDDTVAVNLEDAELSYLSIDPESGAPGLGVEHIKLDSKGDNEIGELSIEDVEDITVTGDGDLEIGEDGEYTHKGRVEAQTYSAGLANVAGSLTMIDASALTGDLVLNLGDEVTGVQDGTSGTKIDINVKGGAGNDTFRLLSGFDSAGDTIDGGTGDNTLVVFDSVADGKISNVQHLDVRNQSDTSFGPTARTIEVDASLFTGLTDITVRNEGLDYFGSATANDSTVVLNKLTADQAKAITVLHSTSGSNGLDNNEIVANLATDTAADTVGLTIKDGTNEDPRFNATLTAAGAESITLNDSDTESNSILLTEFADHTGTLTVTGGQAGQFLNLDAVDGLYDKDLTGGDTDGEDLLDGGGAGSGAVRTVFSKIDASTFTGDLIARVGVTNIDITTGSGDDTIIFDADDLHSGLSISDKVNLGAGDDTVAIDGFFAATVSVGASEWTNFKGVDNIRLVDNDAGGYFLTLTNELVDQTDGGSVINIINDLDVDNDGSAPDTESDVTIDARALIASNFFTYDGAESGEGDLAWTVNERFILSDANINGGSNIDGGYAQFDTANGNNDVIEVRNAAVVTVGDLANISNISELEFTNDTAAVQTSVLELDTATIERLVNTTHTGKAGDIEVLAVTAIGNGLVPGANTIVKIDLTNVNFATTGVVLSTEAGGFFEITGGTGPVSFFGGSGDDNFTGTSADDVINGGAGADTLTGGADADIFVFGTGDTGITVLTADTITDFATGVDDISSNFIFGVDTYTEADGSAMSFATIVTNANGSFAGGSANVYAAYNAGGSGNAFVLIDNNLSGTFDNGDVFVILEGVNTAAELADTDFI